MKRAIKLIDAGASIPEICASINNEAAFQALAGTRRAERNRRKKGKAPKIPVVGGGAKPIVEATKFDESYTPERTEAVVVAKVEGGETKEAI